MGGVSFMGSDGYWETYRKFHCVVLSGYLELGLGTLTVQLKQRRLSIGPTKRTICRGVTSNQVPFGLLPKTSGLGKGLHPDGFRKFG